jgi:predicted alpha/beta-hydrolase family hydrolase
VPGATLGRADEDVCPYATSGSWAVWGVEAGVEHPHTTTWMSRTFVRFSLRARSMPRVPQRSRFRYTIAMGKAGQCVHWERSIGEWKGGLEVVATSESMVDIGLRVHVGDGSEEVSALLSRPLDAQCLLVLGHGAGAGMRHRGMEALSAALALAGVATFRYQFPYMERGGGAPDSQQVSMDTVRAAVVAAADAAPDLPLFAGGRSYGGRMTSNAAAAAPLPRVRGIVFFGFPLHPAGRPATSRAKHLAGVTVPMLFLQGTRDQLAEIELLSPVVESLGKLATLRVIDVADHSFHVLKRSSRTDEEILAELAQTVRDWTSCIMRG